MTVVIEDQVKTITAEIGEQFGCECGKNTMACPFFASEIKIEDVVRAVIAQYDISSIARQDVFEQCAKIAEQWDGIDNVAAQIRRTTVFIDPGEVGLEVARQLYSDAALVRKTGSVTKEE